MGVRMARQVLFDATDVGFAFFDPSILEVRVDVRMAETGSNEASGPSVASTYASGS
jgi:hypothetical protein